MSLAVSTKPIERIQFFKGQRLFAADLQDLEEFNRLMRWLHNQSLHQAGVASGYSVTGNKSDSQITVQPGYAIDSHGREIVLIKSTVIQVPPVANDGQGNAVYYDLVVSYPDDSDLKETETRDGVCVSRSAVRLREAPTFCWAELVPTSDPTGTPSALTAARKAKLVALNKDIESGNRIRLARAEVLNCQLNQPLSVAERRNARPPAQPFISAGNTASATTKWSAAVAPSLGVTLTLSVDTSAAQFRSVPRYIANVVGDRSVQVTIPTPPTARTLLIDGFVRIDAASVSGFTFSLLIPSILIDHDLSLSDVAKALPDAVKSWYVVWMGVEG
jgi:hypothetical protein